MILLIIDLIILFIGVAIVVLGLFLNLLLDVENIEKLLLLGMLLMISSLGIDLIGFIYNLIISV